MSEFQARISWGPNVILPDISVELEESSGPSFFSWKGRFTLAAGSQLTPRQTYTLELSDGRRGSFYLATQMPDASGATVVTFQGTGSLMQS